MHNGCFVSRKSNQIKMRRKGFVLLALLLAVTAVATVVAKYLAERRFAAEAASAGFFVSSNYLEVDSAEHIITGNGNSFEIELYNYEKENIAKICQTDINYAVVVPSGWTYIVKDESGNNIGQTNGIYKFSQSNTNTKHVVYVTHNGTEGTVEIQTKAPFAQTLSATFTPMGNQLPAYSVTNHQTHCVVKIESNDYTGNITVNWNADLCAPDNTDPNMRQWRNSAPSQTLAVQPNTAYELIFFYTSASAVPETQGSGTTVSLGG